VRYQVIAIAAGLGVGGVFWIVWDYINHLRRQIGAMHERIGELQGRNDELILALEDRRDSAQIDEAIRKGKM